MKVKQTVAALCLAAVMATSVGAAAVHTWPPLHSEGKWSHGVKNSIIYSDFQSLIHNWSWACVQDSNNKTVDNWVHYPNQAHAETKKTGGIFGSHREYWDHWGDFGDD